ncbi:MAG TPA: hypothetical protein VFR09_06285, partial [Alphaproteobacteria bacterium]|nr:hypothetical protein [Alphaproteobacteria bacterium]
RTSTGAGLGQLGAFFGYAAIEGQEKFFRSTYIINVKAKFDISKTNHPDMPKYIDWANNIISILKELDHNTYWNKIKEWQMLRITPQNKSVR